MFDQAQMNTALKIAMNPSVKEAFALYDVSLKGFTKFYLTYEEYEGSEDEGSEDCLITLEKVSENHWKLDCPVYYCSSGVFSMEITQPLSRALRTFAAALAMDTEIEVNH